MQDSYCRIYVTSKFFCSSFLILRRGLKPQPMQLTHRSFLICNQIQICRHNRKMDLGLDWGGCQQSVSQEWGESKRGELKKTSFLLSIPSLLTGVGGAISSGQTLMWMIVSVLGLTTIVKRFKQWKQGNKTKRKRNFLRIDNFISKLFYLPNSYSKCYFTKN